MSPKMKENVEITWRALTTALLAVGVYFLIRLNDKVDYSYEANVKQSIINEKVEDAIKNISKLTDKIEINLDRLAERHYNLESKVNRNTQ